MNRKTTERLALAAVALLALPLTLAAAPRPAAQQAEEEPEVRRHRHREVWVLDDEGNPKGVHGPMRGGFLGIESRDLTPELRAHFGAPEDAGVIVGRVLPDSAAAAAGLQVGDVIAAVDGEKVKSGWQLAMALRRHEPGESVDLEVWRDRRRLDFTATLGEVERGAFDVGRMFRWRTGGEGEPVVLDLEGLESLGELEIDPEIWEGIGERLGQIDWEGFAARFQGPNPELLERLEKLEARLRELERELAAKQDR